MHTVLIAHGNPNVANLLDAQLKDAGYRTVTCGGPWPPKLRCIRCDVGYCPLTEGADLMIYDPELVGIDDEGNVYNLALDSARAHPEVPMILVSGSEESSRTSEIIAQAPHVVRAASTGAELVAQLRSALTSTPGQVIAVRPLSS